MKVQAPLLLSDRLYLFRAADLHAAADVLLARPTTYFTIDDEGPFLDGPVTPRVAVVDLDTVSGALHPGARLRKAGKRIDGEYEVREALLDPDVDPLALEDRQFVQVSVFATVYRTITFFEELLGRRLSWAFGRSQLLIVPRAGEMQNAFYERETGSLQFFEFRPGGYRGEGGAQTHSVLTALSHDIVAHEATHAILDGIAPDLYHAATPESLALHESVADLAAIFLTLLEEVVIWSLAYISSSTLDLYDALAWVAEEFGHDIREGGADFLRNANNDRVLSGAGGKSVNRHSPHECSEVLTGAVYAVFRRHAEGLSGEPDKSIRRAANDVARAVFPALDLLPPGEATFADLGRAVSTWAKLRGTGEKLARWLREELVRRGAADHISEMEAVPFDHLPAWPRTEDAAKYVEEHRVALGIPPGATLRMSEISRRRISRQQQTCDRILRVSWDVEEWHEVGSGLTGQWSFATGLVLVADEVSGKVLATVAAMPDARMRHDRGRQLRLWAEDGLLIAGDIGEPVSTAILAERHGGQLRLSGSARSLHIVG